MRLISLPVSPFAARVTGDRLGMDLAVGLPAITAYVAAVDEDPALARVFAEMEEGLARLVRSG